MSDFIKQLKEQINIADVIGEYVRLKKTGSNYMGLCPFHGERSASFSVSEKKGIYHCFGCLKSGDAISFLQEIQSISFQEAVQILASRLKISVPPELRSRGAGAASGSPVLSKQEIFYKLNRFVAQFYHEKLMSPSGKNAREYLKNRGVSEEAMRSAYLGFASQEWSDLYDFLVSKKAPLQVAEELGLIRKKSSGADASGREHYDLFRDRVLFPVIDTRGRVIAFGARALGHLEGPKYLNSSDSPIFKKSSTLYGIFSAQKDIRAEDSCIVVEGFMDCLSLQQAGLGQTVATLGTALTEKHVEFLKRLTKDIVLLFDGDLAGQEAQIRAMEAFLSAGVVVRGVSLPDEYDPDEFIREKGVEALRELIRRAPFMLDQQILALATKAGAHTEARSRAMDQILPWIAKIQSETAQMFRLEQVSGLFDMKLDVLLQAFDRLKVQSKGAQSMGRIERSNVSRQPVNPGGLSRAFDVMDISLIENILMHSGFFSSFSQNEELKMKLLDGLESESLREFVLKLFNQIQVSDGMFGTEILSWTEIPAFRALLSGFLMRMDQVNQSKKDPEAEKRVEQGILDLVKKLVRRGLERKKERMRATILKADSAGDAEEVKRLMNQYYELVRSLDETKI